MNFINRYKKLPGAQFKSEASPKGWSWEWRSRG